MSIKLLSHDALKRLYIQKIHAIEKKDKIFLEELRRQYPELFDKRFLYDMLKKEFEITSRELSPEVDEVLKEAIRKYHKTH